MSGEPIIRHHLCVKLSFYLKHMDKAVMCSLSAKAKQLFQI